MSLIIAAVFGIFLYLQSFFIYGGDSAEFATTSSSFSIPHPPGYPLYSLLGNLIIRFIPFSTIPWRLSLLSSIPTILTAILIYFILFYFLKNKFISFFSSLFYLFLFPIWLYAELPEVFALNNFLIALITYLILKYNNRYNDHVLLIIYWLIGLAIAHHHTFVLFIPGWYYLIKKEYRSTLLTKSFWLKLLFLFLGVVFYFYAPVASLFNPPVDWENAKSIIGLSRLITRASYGTFKAYTSSSPLLITQLLSMGSVFYFFIKDFRILGVFFIVIGLLFVRKINRNLALFLYISFFSNLFFLFYANFFLISTFDLAAYERFLTFIYLLLIFPFGIGIYIIFQYLIKFINRTVTNSFLRFLTRQGFFLFLIIFLLIIFLTNLSKIILLRKISLFEDTGKTILDLAPKNAVLILEDDAFLFPSMYEYYIRNHRQDIKFIHMSLLFRDYYRERISQQFPEIYLWSNKEDASSKKKYEVFLKKNSQKFNILHNSPPNIGYWLPYGLLWKYYPTREDAIRESDNLINVNNKFWQTYRIPKLTTKMKDFLYLLDLQKKLINAYSNYGKFLIYNDKIQEADVVLQTIYHTYQMHFYDPELIKLYTQLKDCLRASYYFNQMRESDFLNKSVDLKILIQYFGVCKVTSSDPEKYIKKYQELKQREDVSLDKL